MRTSKVTKIIILPKEEAIAYKPSSPTVAFRIFDAMKDGGYGPKGCLQQGYFNTFCFTFDDVDVTKHTPESLSRTIKADGIKKIFDESLAAKVISSFEVVMGLCDTLMVHCRAGASRSPAVAAALMDLYSIKKAIVPRDTIDDFAPEGSGLVSVKRQTIEDAFSYNRHVYNLIIREAQKER